MNAFQHVGSTAIGFVTSASVVEQTTQLPASKGEIIALISAVVVQSVIYGITKLFSWLKKKTDKSEQSTVASK